jgi:hypothetical protein
VEKAIGSALIGRRIVRVAKNVEQPIRPHQMDTNNVKNTIGSHNSIEIREIQLDQFAKNAINIKETGLQKSYKYR